jgi:hypothetical protein
MGSSGCCSFVCLMPTWKQQIGMQEMCKIAIYVCEPKYLFGRGVASRSASLSFSGSLHVFKRWPIAPHLLHTCFLPVPRSLLFLYLLVLGRLALLDNLGGIISKYGCALGHWDWPLIGMRIGSYAALNLATEKQSSTYWSTFSPLENMKWRACVQGLPPICQRGAEGGIQRGEGHGRRWGWAARRAAMVGREKEIRLGEFWSAPLTWSGPVVLSRWGQFGDSK